MIVTSLDTVPMTKALESVKTSEADGRQTGQIESDLHCKLGVTKRCRLSWLTNSALVYESKCRRRGGGVAGSQPMSTANYFMSTAVHMGAQINPNKLWSSNSVFNLWLQTIVRKKFGSTKVQAVL